MKSTPPLRELRRELARKNRNPLRRRLLWGAIVIILVLGLFVFVVLPPVLRSQAEHRLSALLKREVKVVGVRFNPFDGSITVKDLSVRERDGQSLVSWRRLHLAFSFSSLWAEEWRLDELSVDGLDAKVVINASGQLNFADLFSGGPAPAQPAQPATASTAHPVLLRRFNLTDAKITFTDRSRRTPFVTELSAINLQLRDLHTSGSISAYHEVSATTEAGEQLAWQGSLKLAPLSSEGDLRISRLQLKKHAPYFGHLLSGELSSGQLDFNCHYRLSFRPGLPELKLTDGTLTLANVVLTAGPNNAPVVNSPLVALEGITADVFAPALALRKLTLTGGHLDLQRAQTGELNLVRLLQAPTSAPAPLSTGPASLATSVTSPPPPPLAPGTTTTTTAATAPGAPSAPPMPVTVEELSLTGLGLDWTDYTLPKPARLSLTALSLSVKDIRLASSANPLAVTLTGQLTPGGNLAATGTVQLAPLSAELALNAENLPLSPLNPYLQSFAQLRLSGGTLSSQLRLNLSPAGLLAQGSLQIDRLATLDATGEPWVKFNRLQFNGFSVQSQPLQLRFEAIELDQPVVPFSLYADRTSNVSALFAPPARPSTPAGISPSDPTPTVTYASTGSAAPVSAASAPDKTAAPGVAWSLGRLTIADGALIFSDRSITPGVRTTLTALRGTVADLSSSTLNRADVSFNGQMDGVGQVALTGKLDTHALSTVPGAVTDLRLKVQGMDLSPLGPYVGTYAGYELLRGTLGLDSRVRLTERRLDTQTVVTLNQFTLGPATRHPLATKLPVRLGVGLLKDTDGRIIIDLPVRGSLDDPNFRISRVALRVIVNLLTKAAVSPFSLLSAAFGGSAEELSFQLFPPGEVRPQEGEIAKLTALRKALQNRPALNLDITGGYDPAADALALQEKRLLTQLQARWLEDLQNRPTAQPIPDDLSVPPAEEARLLALLYRESLATGRLTAVPPAAADSAADRLAASANPAQPLIVNTLTGTVTSLAEGSPPPTTATTNAAPIPSPAPTPSVKNVSFVYRRGRAIQRVFTRIFSPAPKPAADAKTASAAAAPPAAPPLPPTPAAPPALDVATTASAPTSPDVPTSSPSIDPSVTPTGENLPATASSSPALLPTADLSLPPGDPAAAPVTSTELAASVLDQPKPEASPVASAAFSAPGTETPGLASVTTEPSAAPLLEPGSSAPDALSANSPASNASANILAPETTAPSGKTAPAGNTTPTLAAAAASANPPTATTSPAVALVTPPADASTAVPDATAPLPPTIEQRARLLASIAVTEDELRELARARAQTVRQLLLLGSDLDASRLLLMPAAAKTQGARVLLSLE